LTKEGKQVKPIIVASIGLFASVITVSLSFYFTKRLQLKTEDRRLKEEYYKPFLKSLSDVATDNNNDKAQEKLSESINFLLVIASPQVVKDLMEFHSFVRQGAKDKFPRWSQEWGIEHDRLLKSLIKSIRVDLFGEEKNIDKYMEKLSLVGRRK